MFSGIVEEVGKISRIFSEAGTSICEVSAEKIYDDLKPGDSISINGVCLTVEEIGADSFRVSLSRQTLKETNLSTIRPGDFVNLERAMKVGDRIGGHILTGHIDFKTPLTSFYREGKSAVIVFSLPFDFRKYVVKRGSIGVDGLSLTVAELNGAEVKIFIIPYTIENTNLNKRRCGELLNIEVDITAKQIEKILLSREGKEN